MSYKWLSFGGFQFKDGEINLDGRVMCVVNRHRPNTGNWRHGDFHPARFAALSAAPPCLRFTGHVAAPSAKLGAERIATPFS
jgi:hypothetical protein